MRKKQPWTFRERVQALNAAHTEWVGRNRAGKHARPGQKFNSVFCVQIGLGWMITRLRRNPQRFARVLNDCRPEVRADWCQQITWQRADFMRQFARGFTAYRNDPIRFRIPWSRTYLERHWGRDGVNFMIAASRHGINLDRLAASFKGAIRNQWTRCHHPWNTTRGKQTFIRALSEWRCESAGQVKSGIEIKRFNTYWMRRHGFGWLLEAARDHAGGIHALAKTIPAVAGRWSGKANAPNHPREKRPREKRVDVLWSYRAEKAEEHRISFHCALPVSPSVLTETQIKIGMIAVHRAWKNSAPLNQRARFDISFLAALGCNALTHEATVRPARFHAFVAAIPEAGKDWRPRSNPSAARIRAAHLRRIAHARIISFLEEKDTIPPIARDDPETPSLDGLDSGRLTYTTVQPTF